jgi:hypothetical protein
MCPIGIHNQGGGCGETGAANSLVGESESGDRDARLIPRDTRDHPLRKIIL